MGPHCDIMPAMAPKTRNMTDLLTVTEAAKDYPLSGRQLRHLLLKGLVEGRCFGRTWALSRASLEAYLAQDRRPGRKPKKTP